MSNLLQKYLHKDQIVLLDDEERFTAITSMNRLLQKHCGCSSDVADQMVSREKVLSTAVGNHIAVPHVRSDSINGIHVALGVSRTGINWDAIDGLPVHLVFVVTAPLRLNRDYLHLLADIVRNFNNIDQVLRLAAINDQMELQNEVLQIIND